MTDDKRDAPKSIRIYPPIWRALIALGVKNLCWLVNKALAEMLGIPITVILPYKRTTERERDEG